MVKGFLTSLLLLISVHLAAQPSPYYLDHDTFVHLTSSEQKKVLVGFMQFMVELEEMYPREVLTSEHQVIKEELKKKIVLYLRTFETLLLANAYAQNDQSPDPFEIYRKKFEATMLKVTTSKTNNMCVYGGWISTIGANGKCSHPSRGTINSYVLPRGMQLSSEQIACNPLIFGYKDPVKKTLFSAVANSSAINSSLDCMQQSQGKKKDKNGDLVIDKNIDARMQQLKDAYLSSTFKDQYNAMTKFVHQTCLCNDGSNHMDQSYLKRIQPHRTCFSLLNQYRNLRDNGCSSNIVDLGLNVDNIQQIFEKNILDMEIGLDNLAIKNEASLTSAEKAKLTDLDNSFKDLLGDKENQDKFCEAQKAGTQTCKLISCSQGANNALSCKVEILNTKSANKIQTVSMTNGSAIVKGMIPTQALKAQDVTCNFIAPTCEVAQCKDDKCPVTIKGGTLADKKDENLSFGTEKSKTVQVIPDGMTGEGKDKSSFAITCSAPPKEATCEVSKCVADASGGKECEFTVKGGALKDANQKKFTANKDETEVKVTLVGDKEILCKVKDEEVKDSCSVDIQAIENDAVNVSITVTLTIGDILNVNTPSFDPATVVLKTDDKKLVWTGQAAVSSLKDVPFKVSNFSKKDPAETCSETYPNTEEPLGLTIENPKPDPDNKDKTKVIYVIIGHISPDSKEEAEKVKVTWTNATQTDDTLVAKIEQTDKAITVCIKHPDVKPVEEHCKKIDAKETPKYTLDLSGKNSNNKDFKVHAKVNDGTKEIADKLDNGLTLVWYEKGKAEATQEEKDKKIKDDAEKKAAKDKKDAKKPKSGAAGDSTGDTKTEKTEEKKTVEVAGQVQSGIGLDYSAPINTTKYEICADLMKDGKKEDSKCLSVPSYVAPTAPMPGQPPVPGAYRYRRW